MQSTSNAYFKQVADQWDDLRKGFFPDSLRDEVIAKAYLLPEMEIADIGAGSGFLSSILVDRVRMVHLVDASEEMLSQAKKNLSTHTNTVYHLAEGRTIPLPDASQDAVIANMYLHHAPDPIAAIQEMVRLLKPGGRLLISDLDLHPHTWLQEEMADEWPGFARDQVMAWFKTAGLVNSYISCSGANCCGTSKTDEHQALRSAFSSPLDPSASVAKRMCSNPTVSLPKVDVVVAAALPNLLMAIESWSNPVVLHKLLKTAYII
jgi:ubiquinone/menaquinone biosynthesis C-methylase UbiE